MPIIIWIFQSQEIVSSYFVCLNIIFNCVRGSEKYGVIKGVNAWNLIMHCIAISHYLLPSFQIVFHFLYIVSIGESLCISDNHKEDGHNKDNHDKEKKKTNKCFFFLIFFLDFFFCAILHTLQVVEWFPDCSLFNIYFLK